MKLSPASGNPNNPRSLPQCRCCISVRTVTLRYRYDSYRELVGSCLNLMKNPVYLHCLKLSFPLRPFSVLYFHAWFVFWKQMCKTPSVTGENQVWLEHKSCSSSQAFPVMSSLFLILMLMFVSQPKLSSLILQSN